MKHNPINKQKSNENIADGNQTTMSAQSPNPKMFQHARSSLDHRFSTSGLGLQSKDSQDSGSQMGGSNVKQPNSS